eukprot:CAMPEP_0196777708 /NCGR_PEP_ID=MMETSP1104-20130614/5381_1 /TAXON_ID=33652 /ORGANISM="Cafeteria sp., Strain Caron Lab Isolate" /LENGTH=121 /DNA_ID=CAMNT_0042147875 /DNA_START=113 /DNA_END=475 /DNA_ORIENTATION=-
MTDVKGDGQFVVALVADADPVTEHVEGKGPVSAGVFALKRRLRTAVEPDRLFAVHTSQTSAEAERDMHNLFGRSGAARLMRSLAHSLDGCSPHTSVAVEDRELVWDAEAGARVIQVPELLV